MTATTEELVEAVRTSNLDFETRRALYARLEAAVQQPNRDAAGKAIMDALDSLWVSDDRVLGKLHARDEILAALAVPATGETEWRKAAEVVLAEVKINGTPALEFIDKVVTP